MYRLKICCPHLLFGYLFVWFKYDWMPCKLFVKLLLLVFNGVKYGLDRKRILKILFTYINA